MTFDDYTPRFPDGRPMFVGLRGEALSARQFDAFMRDKRRFIRRTYLRIGRERVMVSTMHLGVDHSFMSDVPILWETMVFGGPCDGLQGRYSSRAHAIEGHALAVVMSREFIASERRDRARRRRLHSSYRARWA